MKKSIFVALTFLVFTALLFVACKKEQDGLEPGYSYESGTGSNPDNTSMGTSSGTTTSTSVGSTSTTGATMGTSTGATTSSTGGTTTSTPTGSYFKINSTVYNCASVTGGIWNSSWSIIGRSAAGDTCSVSFTAIPAAGSYPQTASLFSPAPNECMVAIQVGTTVYIGDAGNAVITVPGGSQRKVTISGMSIMNLNTSAMATLNASMTTP